MNRLRTLAVSVYDFLAGDDPIVAAGVVLVLALTATLAASGVPAWWLPVLAVPALLALGLARAVRQESSKPS